MRKLLFKLHNVLVACEGMDEFEITDRGYSCLWDIYPCSAGGEDYAQIDISSVKSQVKVGDQWEWRPDAVPNNVIAELEEKLQAEIWAEAQRVRALLRDEQRRRA